MCLSIFLFTFVAEMLNLPYSTMNKFHHRSTLFFMALVLASAGAYATDIPEYTIVKETVGSLSTTLVVHYESQNADCTGTEILSGLISIPTTTTPVSVVLDNHYTMTKNSEAPSVAGSPSSSTLFEEDMVIVATDYLGYGSTVDKAHPYLCHHQNAVSSIDLALVARDILMKREIPLEVDALFNFGYSQGGGVALAVHREMEADKEMARQLHFVKSYCGAGPYDLAATLEDGLSSERLGLPAALPLVVKGLLAGFPQCFAEGRTFADFFRPELIKAGLESWLDSKMLSTNTISSKMLAVTKNDSRAAAFLSEEVMAPESPLRQELLAVVAADNMLDGWKPTFSLKFYHSTADEVVPFVNTQNAVAALGLKESDQSVSSVGISHSNYGVMYYILAANDMRNEIARIKNEPDTNGYYLPITPIMNDDDTPTYNLQGRPVGPDYHGIVIRNHRKIWMP